MVEEAKVRLEFKANNAPFSPIRPEVFSYKDGNGVTLDIDLGDVQCPGWGTQYYARAYLAARHMLALPSPVNSGLFG